MSPLVLDLVLTLVIFLFFLSWTVVLVGVPVTAALFLLRRGRRLPAITRRPWRSAALVTAVAYGAWMCAFVFSMGPWRTGVVTAGKTPEGREFCVIQTFQDMLEPFTVRLYVRTDNGVWKGYYLEHEDHGWRAGGVEIANGTARVTRDGVHFRDVPLTTQPVDLTALPSDEGEWYFPATFGLADLEMKQDRRLAFYRAAFGR